VPGPTVLVLSWNLFHGRAMPSASRSLFGEFVAKLAEWSWDMALLQEVPPWWPPRLARDLGAEQRSALTSRNWLLPLRRALAERRPELLRSNGGGCNAILSRTPIAEHSTLRLRRWPERRVAQLARLQDGTRIVNVHASTSPTRAEQELERLWRHVLVWAGSDRLILGGDFNLRTPPAAPTPSPTDTGAPAGAISHVAALGVDHLFARGLLPVADWPHVDSNELQLGLEPGRSCAPHQLNREVLSQGRRVELSDHAPLLVRLQAEVAD